jgi:hypothetical protein
MYTLTIYPNEYLHTETQGFYHTDYVGYKKTGNPDYINVLKNTFCDVPRSQLENAARRLKDVLLEDLPQIISWLNSDLLTVCTVPRAKAEANYKEEQKFFRQTVSFVVTKLPGVLDGTHYISRHTDTKTTHIKKQISIPNDGPEPYPGITKDTCRILTSEINGKNILLVDDIYTKTVNIDEDAIQTLLDSGAKVVFFYAVGKTIFTGGD